MLINTGDGKVTYSYESTPKAGVIEVDEAGEPDQYIMDIDELYSLVEE